MVTSKHDNIESTHSEDGQERSGQLNVIVEVKALICWMWSCKNDHTRTSRVAVVTTFLLIDSTPGWCVRWMALASNAD